MKFQPMTEEDAAAVNLMAKGEYDAVVRAAEEKTSQSGNQMFALQLTVYDGDAQKHVFDYLVFTDGGHAKIQRFCKSADIWETYQSGELTPDGLLQLNVRVKIGIEDGKDGYPPKNKVVDYLPRNLPPKRSAANDELRGPSVLPGVDPAQRREALAARPADDIPF